MVYRIYLAALVFVFIGGAYLISVDGMAQYTELDRARMEERVREAEAATAAYARALKDAR